MENTKLKVLTLKEPSAPRKPVPTCQTERTIKLRSRLIETCAIRWAAVAVEESVDMPLTYKEALSSLQSVLWQCVMDDEHNALLKTRTYTLVPCDAGMVVLPSKWVYKLKLLANSRPERFKGRIVVCGNRQVHGIDYYKTYSPVMCYDSLCFVLVLAAHYDLDVHLVDIDSAFLQADLEETVHVEPPAGCRSADKPTWIWRLNKSLYGLKQAPIAWNKLIDEHLCSSGFTPMAADPCVYVKWVDNCLSIIGLYMDNCLIITHQDLLTETKNILSSCFPTKDLREVTSVLGTEVLCDRGNGCLSIQQSGHIGGILKLAGMTECRPTSLPMMPGLQLEAQKAPADDTLDFPYQELVGKLLFVAQGTRPDIAYAVSYLSRFVGGWDKSHCEAIRHLLRYLQGTRHVAINYYCRQHQDQNQSIIPEIYSDSDWAGDTIDRKSVSGWLVMMGGGPIAWSSKKQKTVAQSSCEAELAALSEATKQALYLAKLLPPLNIKPEAPLLIWCDSQSTIAVVLKEGKAYHTRLKHFAVKHFFVLDNIGKGIVDVKYLSTKEMIADILTKPLPGVIIGEHMNTLGMA